MLKKVNQKGFTIIEVLIVLAIAGLIMLIVFLAVPALQRNSTNTAIKNDATRVAAGVTDWTANNRGQAFTAGTGNVNTTALINSIGELGELSLNTTNLAVATGQQAGLTSIAPPSPTVRIVTGATCGANGATVAVTGDPRATAVQYSLESGSATRTAACINVN